MDLGSDKSRQTEGRQSVGLDTLRMQLSRRRLLQSTAGMAAFGLLAACGGDDDDDDDTGAAEPTATDESASTDEPTDPEVEEDEGPTEAGEEPTGAAEEPTTTEGTDDEPAAELPFEELIIGLGEDTTIMDPDLDQGLNDMYRLIFNTPVVTGPSGEAQPDLATSWEYPDDTTLVMHLREDVTWQDGTPLTAQDFVYTWQRMSDPNRASTNFPRFEPWLEDVVATDDYTVEFRTLEPFAPALDTLTGFWIAPRHYIEEVGDDEFGLLPLGSGPYRVVEWQKDQFLNLEAVEDWWGGDILFPRVRFVIVTESFTRTTAMLSGEIHIVSEPPVSMIGQIESSDGHYIATSPGRRIQFIQFPHVSTRKENTPEIDNKLVRQALNYALDRKAIVEAVGQGFFTVVPGPWPPGSWAYPEDAEEQGYSYDPDRARELLAEAGYADGFTLWFGTSNGFSLMDNELMQACVPYYQDIGLKVEFISLEWAAFDPARDGNEFSMYYLGLTGNTDPHGSANFYMTSAGRPRGFYGTDPEIDEVIWQGARIVDFEERQQYYRETVFPTIIDIAPWVFCWTPTVITGVDKRLSYEAGPDGFIDVMKIGLA